MKKVLIVLFLMLMLVVSPVVSAQGSGPVITLADPVVSTDLVEEDNGGLWDKFTGWFKSNETEKDEGLFGWIKGHLSPSFLVGIKDSEGNSISWANPISYLTGIESGDSNIYFFIIIALFILIFLIFIFLSYQSNDSYNLMVIFLIVSAVILLILALFFQSPFLFYLIFGIYVSILFWLINKFRHIFVNTPNRNIIGSFLFDLNDNLFVIIIFVIISLGISIFYAILMGIPVVNRILQVITLEVLGLHWAFRGLIIAGLIYFIPFTLKGLKEFRERKIDWDDSLKEEYLSARAKVDAGVR